MDRCGHLSVLIHLDPVLFVANGAYRCHFFISSLFLSLMHCLQGVSHSRMMGFYVGLSLAQICVLILTFFFRRACFPVSESPCFVLRIEMFPFPVAEKELQCPGPLRPLSPLPPCEEDVGRCIWVGVISESVARGSLLKTKGFSVPAAW